MRYLKQISMVFIVMVCIVMHAVSVMPHHHHDNMEVPCINPMHCIGMNDCSHHENTACGDSHDCEQPACGHSGCNHAHHSDDDNCSYDISDAVTPERVRDVDLGLYLSAISLDIFGISPLSFFIDYDDCGPACPDGHLRHPLPVSFFGEYYVRALAPRAPSFTV